MKENSKELIFRTMEYGGILDAMLALQERDGYLTREAAQELAEAFDMYPSEVYDTASFYSMIKLSKPKGKTEILICRGAPCLVAGSAKLIEAVENLLGIKVGETTHDGEYSFDYTECLGQCQAAPSLLINNKLYIDMTPEKLSELLKGGLTGD